MSLGFLSPEAIHPDRSPVSLFLTPEQQILRKKTKFFLYFSNGMDEKNFQTPEVS